MNKSERVRLAKMVSEMKTSFQSTPEVVFWGERLLSEFPSISKSVEQYDDVHKIENIASSYVSYIVRMSCTSFMGEKRDFEICNLGTSGGDNLYHVFDEYFCHESSYELSELEDELGGEEVAARDMVKNLLSDAVFIETINHSEDLSPEQKALFAGELLNQDWK